MTNSPKISLKNGEEPINNRLDAVAKSMQKGKWLSSELQVVYNGRLWRAFRGFLKLLGFKIDRRDSVHIAEKLHDYINSNKDELIKDFSHVNQNSQNLEIILNRILPLKIRNRNDSVGKCYKMHFEKCKALFSPEELTKQKLAQEAALRLQEELAQKAAEDQRIAEEQANKEKEEKTGQDTQEGEKTEPKAPENEPVGGQAGVQEQATDDEKKIAEEENAPEAETEKETKAQEEKSEAETSNEAETLQEETEEQAKQNIIANFEEEIASDTQQKAEVEKAEQAEERRIAEELIIGDLANDSSKENLEVEQKDGATQVEAKNHAEEGLVKQEEERVAALEAQQKAEEAAKAEEEKRLADEQLIKQEEEEINAEVRITRKSGVSQDEPIPAGNKSEVAQQVNQDVSNGAAVVIESSVSEASEKREKDPVQQLESVIESAREFSEELENAKKKIPA